MADEQKQLGQYRVGDCEGWRGTTTAGVQGGVLRIITTETRQLRSIVT